MVSSENVGGEQASRRSRHRDVFLFSHPRTASNLLTRLLSTQPGWTQKEYHFIDAFHHTLTACAWDAEHNLPPEDRKKYDEMFQEGLARLNRERDAAVVEEKCLFIKNHAPHLWDPEHVRRHASSGTPPTAANSTNPTLLSDDFLLSWQPVFQVRHPALVFDSWYRAESRVKPIDIHDAYCKGFTSLGYSRRLYDWFLANHRPSSCRPIVVDADDVLDGGATLARLCEALGMDPQSICFEWESKTPTSEQAKTIPVRHLSFLQDFWASKSIDKSKSSRGLDVRAKHARWAEDYGGGVADVLLAHVEAAMPDYEYLLSRKI